MSSNASNPPGGFSRRSFFLFLLLAPAGILLIFAIILATQYKQFLAMVSPVEDVSEFSWDSVTQVRLKDISADLHAFTVEAVAGGKPDSLWISSGDLDMIMAASPVAASQGIRFHVEVKDTLLIMHSTQPVQAMQNRFAWIFKKIARSGYLNARLEGYPELKEGRLEFSPIEGFLNGQKIPAIALVKRGGMSPLDFMVNHDFYDAFVQALSEVKVAQGKILLVRKPQGLSLPSTIDAKTPPS